MSYLRAYGTLLDDTTAIYLPLLKYATPTDFAVSADWTPAAGDVKVSIDGGAAANVTNLPTYVTSKGWKFILTAAELTGKNIQVRVADSATKAVCDDGFTVETTANASSMWPDYSTSSPIAADVRQLVGDSTSAGNMKDDYTPAVGYNKDGTRLIANAAITSATFAAAAIDSTAIAANAIGSSQIATDAIGSAELAASAITEIQAGLATTADIPTAAAIRDAVWAKTMSELAAVPGVSDSVIAALEWLFLLSRNKITQTSTTTTLRNDADNATISTSTVSDDGTTATRGEFA